MEKPKIALFCGGPFAFPSIHLLLFEKLLCGVVVGGADKETVQQLSQGMSQVDLPFLILDKPAALNNVAEWLEQTKPDAIFSICFPYRLPPEILSLKPGRFINFHTGPLPAYRGPMPIFEVLRNGEQLTAIAVHLMNGNFDEGDLIFSEDVPVYPNDTFGSLAVRLSERCSLAAHNMANMLEFGSGLPTQPQSKDQAHYFPKPDKRDTFIRWSYMRADEIERLVNACNPWNQGADTIINNRAVKILSVTFFDEEHEYSPGTILTSVAGELKVACIENQILVIHILSDEYGINIPSRFPSHFAPGLRFSG